MAEDNTRPQKPLSAGIGKMFNKGQGQRRPQDRNGQRPPQRPMAPGTPTRLQLPKETVSPEKADDLVNYTGKIITAPGGAMPIPQAQQNNLAIFDDFTLLINENARQKATGIVQSVQKQIEKKFKGSSIKKVYFVKLGTLRDLYRESEKNVMLSSGGTDENTAEYRQHWMDLIRAAARVGASDIHFQTINNITIVEMRVNSSIRQYKHQPSEWGKQLASCMFYMTDASESVYKATDFQAGRISNDQFLPSNVQSVRTQFNPSSDPSSATGGVYVVARLLYAGSRVQGDLDTLGYTAVQMRQLSAMRSKPYGINIIAGVTGSGKSTTLVKMLTGLKAEKPGCNIITIEDPPEYPIPGVKQLPVVAEGNSMEARSAAFTKAISAVMRSDPDVIMIGEIRDNASANLAFEACQTGHQVYASLHASTATSILARLEDIGVENYKLADPTAVTGLIGQRLVPTLCPHCKIKWTDAKEKGLLPKFGYRKDIREDVEKVCGDRIDNVFVKNPEGCPKGSSHKCDLGIAGRQVIAEVITPDMEFMTHIKNHDVVSAQKYWLAHLEGMTMNEHATQQVVRGEVAPMDAQIIGGRFADFDMNRRDIVFGPMMKTAKEWIEENR